MLKLTNITKDYKVADTTVHALKGVSLSFRQSEFVSILGPSGCGKTTLLNIIGGLDKYTSGDMSVNGISTKKFRDADWDLYRNHRIGFIFQSYNLIPHQTVLGNVELALTIAGISKAERIERAKKALDRVGLAGQYYKKPNQLSGGQCQRVAIARALVNEPEILLADEPTGALDTATSVQIMDLVREIASERLVIMVTHNPELAEQYSTRIIRLLDGEVIADTNPFNESEEQEKSETEGGVPTDFDENAQKTETVKDEKVKKKSRAKMGLWTTFRLSAQNLFTKKARTAMTAIAGAIGIIGVSMVLALSSGLQNYINTMQNDMLSGNPIMVQETAFDLNSLMQATAPSDKKQIAQEFGYVNVNSMIENLIAKSNVAESLMIKNTITKEYVDYLKAMPSDHTASIFFDYGLDVANNIYTDFAKTRKSDGSLEVLSTTSLSAIRSQYIEILKKTDFKQYATYVTTVVDNFKQSPASEDYILQQYDLKDGRVATQANEIMIVIDNKSELTDILLAQLGYYSQDEFMNLVYRGAKDQDETMERLYDETLDRDRFTYSELMGKKFTYFPNNTAFNKNTVDMGGQSVTTVTYNPHYKTEWGAGYELEIVGILQPKASVSYGSLKSGFYYTEEFRKKFIADNINSEIVEYYKSQNQSSVSSGWVQVNMGGTPTTMPMGITYPIEFTYYNEDFTAEQTYNETAFVGTPSSMGALMGLAGSMMGGGSGGSSTTSASEFYIYTIQQMGGIDMPNKISVYPPDFESKQRALNYLDAWNGDGDITVNGSVISKDDRQDIVYSDALSVIVDMLNQLINIITIVLIGFTSLSLVVSSVMIAIITYVSVVERTKEIGVIRSLGGRKKDVSRLFTAETAIIGITSGAFGIGVTYGLSAIVNIIVSSLTPLSAIATLPWWQALVMIGVSTLLTLVSGVFPARSAAKKDPVVALRTE